MPPGPNEGDHAPGALVLYVVLLASVAAGSLVAGLYALAAGVDHPIHVGVVTLATVAALLVLQRFPFTFYWREHRLVVSMDEAVVLIGLLSLPPPALLGAMALALTIGQLWDGPPAWIKRGFNLSQGVLAVSLAAGAFIGLTRFGAPPLLAATVAALFYGLCVNLFLAGVFAALSDASLLKVYRERFHKQGTAAALIAVSAGVLLSALWSVHPAATLAAIPPGYLLRRYWKLHAQNDRELEVHRRLADVTHRLVGTSRVQAAAESVLGECEALLNCGRAEIVVRADPEPLKLDRSFADGPAVVEPLSAELPGRDGGPLGELRVWPRRSKERFGEHERALLRTIAGQAASAIENVRAIALARAATDRLDTFLSTAHDAVLVVDLDGFVRFSNPAADRLLASSRSLAGRRAADLFDDVRLTNGSGAPERATLVETTIRLPDLSERRVEAHVGPIHEDGRAAGLLMVARDVTERKRLEEEMRKQREALAHNEKLSLLGTLVAGVAHEVNNPLTYIRGNLELAADQLNERLADPAIPEADRAAMRDVLESVRVSLDGVHRIGGIAESLKRVSRKGTGELKVESVAHLLEEVLVVLRVALPKGVRLDVSVDEGLPEVRVRPSEIHQVLLNLIKNAVEILRGRDDGLVSVRAWRSEDGVHVSVTDNGPGIPPEARAKLFTPFFTTKSEGTGLGLSISRGIAEAHGGELKFDSEVGVGTTFVLTLPLDPPHAVSPG